MSIYHIISLLSLLAATSASPHLLEPRQSSLICPQDNGQDPPLCSSSFCSWSPIAGSCMTRLANQKLSFWECGCCTADKTSCDACGGDAGNSTCVGGGDSGLLFKGFECYNGDGGLPPIFPFPVVPVGWPPPPVGVPRPSKECLEVDMPKCSDCEGINGWCFAGIDAGCLCKEDCATGDEAPKCEDDTYCAGKNGKCTIGPQKDCECQSNVECPKASDALVCEKCGGTDDIGNCKGVSSENNKWKGCECIDLSNEPPPNYGFGTIADLIAGQALLDAAPTVRNTTDVGCGTNSLDNFPMALQATDGVIDPNGLLFRLRQASCTNECSVPQGIPESAVKIYSNGNECEISVAIANNIEAWFYRATPSTGHQWQECWDATEEVINNCIKEGPNKGWWNGVDEYQYYEIGFRALNDPTAKHAPFDSSNTVVSYSLPPTPACSGTQPDQLLNVKCKTNDGLQSVRQILYAIRQELCTNSCGRLLVDSSDSSAVFSNGACEIAIGIPNWEFFEYRATYAEGNTQQDCWGGFEEIINECVTGGEVGLEGWVNAARSEVFKAGVRKKDDPTALHNKYGFGEPGSISCIL